MRKLLLLLLLLGCAALPASAAYSFNRTVTIDHTQVGGSDSTNFPLAVAGTFTDLKTVGNGGSVQNSSGYDVVFTSDAGCTTLMTFEIETYGATTGAIAFWVKVPTVSHTSDTIFYMCYGNSGISTFQGGSAGAVWDANFKAVWHLKDGTTLSGADSTTNGVTLTNTAGTAVAGVVDGALHVAYASNAQMDSANNPFTSATFSANGLTLEAWVNRDTFVGAQDGQVVNMEGAYTLAVANQAINFEINGAGGAGVATMTGRMSLGTWYLIACTADSGGNIICYINGVSSATGTQTYYDLDSLTRGYSLGGRNPSTGGYNIDAGIDETRISNIPRSADWLLTEYNNEKPSPSIPTIGGAAGGGSTARHAIIDR